MIQKMIQFRGIHSTAPLSVSLMQSFSLRLLFSIGLCLQLVASVNAFPLPGMEFMGTGLSSTATRALTAELPSVAPPAELLSPLRGDDDDCLKGLEPTAEAELAAALLSVSLHQRLLKVAVATTDGQRMALVKLQAGDTRTGLFRIDDLQHDAVNALRIAFQLPLDLQQIDLWSVVPDSNIEGPIHRPVFSVSAQRGQFQRATTRIAYARDILGHFGLVRYAPQFLHYAGGQPVANVARMLPETAWAVSPVSDNWPQLRMACLQDPRLSAATLARVVDQIPVSDNSVALTIDDGPHPLITSLMLDILRRRNTHATFFVVGEKVEECPELLRQLVEKGHEIGNHTYTHPRLGTLKDVDALAEIRAGALAIGRVSGKPTPLMRPPGGGFTLDVLRAATAANSTVVLWTHNTNDWLKPSPEVIAANALRDLRPGSIILMHQGGMESVRALPMILDGVEAKGLRVGTVGDLLRQSPVPVLPIPEIMAKYQKPELEKE